MPRPWLWHITSCLVSGCFAAVLVAASASAAIVNEQTIALDVRADGTVREQVTLRVTIERDADFDRWSPYPIFLDSHRRLLDVDASVTVVGGATRKVSRKHRDRAALSGDNVLHSSQEAELVEFPVVPLGSTLRLTYAVEERPYFPSGVQQAGGEDPIEQLHLQVRGGGPTFRYQLGGETAGLAVDESTGGVSVHGAVPALPELAHTADPRGVVLRYAWGSGADWSAVGRWYADLVGQVQQGSPQVREVARALAGTTREEALARAVDFVRAKVRYVAVEVGVGGYRPAAPADVLARRWGDCKDKSLLLVDLLAAAGIEARLALVEAGDLRYLAPDFAAPDGFDHEIVAVPAAGLKLPAGAPVVDGWLFLDATQEGGGLAWLHPASRGRPVLVVDASGGGGGRLIDIPVAPAAETRHLSVELTVGATGAAQGRARFEASGALAVWLADVAASGLSGLAEAATLLTDNLPGGGVTGVKMEPARGAEGAPLATLTADVRLTSALTVAGHDASLILPGAPATPEPSLLDGRVPPLALTPQVAETTWRIELPLTGCTAEAGDIRREEAVGTFEQLVTVTGRTLTVNRRTELRRRLVAGDEAVALAALSVAERRALKKRLRLHCGG